MHLSPIHWKARINAILTLSTYPEPCRPTQQACRSTNSRHVCRTGYQVTHFPTRYSTSAHGAIMILAPAVGNVAGSFADRGPMHGAVSGTASSHRSSSNESLSSSSLYQEPPWLASLTRAMCIVGLSIISRTVNC